MPPPKKSKSKSLVGGGKMSPRSSTRHAKAIKAKTAECAANFLAVRRALKRVANSGGSGGSGDGGGGGNGIDIDDGAAVAEDAAQTEAPDDDGEEVAERVRREDGDEGRVGVDGDGEEDRGMERGQAEGDCPGDSKYGGSEEREDMEEEEADAVSLRRAATHHVEEMEEGPARHAAVVVAPKDVKDPIARVTVPAHSQGPLHANDQAADDAGTARGGGEGDEEEGVSGGDAARRAPEPEGEAAEAAENAREHIRRQRQLAIVQRRAAANARLRAASGAATSAGGAETRGGSGAVEGLEIGGGGVRIVTGAVVKGVGERPRGMAVGTVSAAAATTATAAPNIGVATGVEARIRPNVGFLGRFVSSVQRGNHREIDANERAAGVRGVAAAAASGLRPGLRRAAATARTPDQVRHPIEAPRLNEYSLTNRNL
jgi:hypothetical protein